MYSAMLYGGAMYGGLSGPSTPPTTPPSPPAVKYPTRGVFTAHVQTAQVSASLRAAGLQPNQRTAATINE